MQSSTCGIYILLKLELYFLSDNIDSRSGCLSIRRLCLDFDRNPTLLRSEAQVLIRISLSAEWKICLSQGDTTAIELWACSFGENKTSMSWACWRFWFACRPADAHRNLSISQYSSNMMWKICSTARKKEFWFFATQSHVLSRPVIFIKGWQNSGRETIKFLPSRRV